jgi:two-component system sensor histidine kinase CiaH
MIKKLRLKFVAVSMLLVTAVLLVVFLSMYTSARRNIQHTTRELLQWVISENTIQTPSSDSSSSDDKRGALSLVPGTGKVQLPFFTVEVWNNSTIYVTGGTYQNLESTTQLAKIVHQCLKRSSDEGMLHSYSLRYLRYNNGFFTRIAFVDVSMEKSTLGALMTSYIQIGIASLLLLLGISALLSYWAVKPVEKAWIQQRQFLSDASHELKTPLTVILSNAELLESSSLPERPARWSDNIHSEAVRMKTLVEEMLTLARADNMVRTSVYTEVNFSDVATDASLLFEPVAFEAGKRLESDIAESIAVSGDADKLKQVIAVLLDNAIKYGEAGKPIRLTLERTEKQARLQVANENGGVPIPPEQLSRLFERFYRADDSRGEQSGFGLGLPIAAAIAAEHKGTLKVESDRGSTRFIFTLPLKKD